MSLLVAFDDINSNGNNFLHQQLWTQFPILCLEGNDIAKEVKKYPAAKCLFTTSIRIAQISNALIPTILYINDPFETCSARQDNITSWRQNLSAFSHLDSIFVVSSALATAFLTAYRIPCKVQYPYVPKGVVSNPGYILYNRTPSHITQMLDFASHESFLEYSSPEDFKEAKLYIHIPEFGEQWHINVILAHSYGVPCMTYQQGCFSEFCTTGDKVVPVGCDARTWLNNFKVALRDHAVNSKTVYEMSQRFQAMNEIQQRIKKALLENGMTKSPPTFDEVQHSASGEALKRLQGRQSRQSPSSFAQKILRPSAIRGNDYSHLINYLNSNSRIYAGVGGLGDALLILASSFSDPDAKIVFGPNGGVRDAVKQLFDTFDKGHLLVHNFNGSAEGMAAWNAILDHANFKGCAHVPRDLGYGDWNTNAKSYFEQMVTRLPLIKVVGKLVNPRATKKVIGLAPRGSDHNSTWKQRFLTREEYHKLVKKLLEEDATVLVFGSEDDLSYYGVYQDNNVIFMNSNFAVSHPAPKYPITMRHMLSGINACEHIISVDSWVKTYAALAGIPCTVIMNRYFGKSSMEHIDPSDRIFLDPLVWGFKITALESLL